MLMAPTTRSWPIRCLISPIALDPPPRSAESRAWTGESRTTLIIEFCALKPAAIRQSAGSGNQGKGELAIEAYMPVETQP